MREHGPSSDPGAWVQGLRLGSRPLQIREHHAKLNAFKPYAAVMPSSSLLRLRGIVEYASASAAQRAIRELWGARHGEEGMGRNGKK